ncbi:MAG: Hsp20/alpha crystallin family protein [Methylomonas sp.]
MNKDTIAAIVVGILVVVVGVQSYHMSKMNDRLDQLIGQNKVAEGTQLPPPQPGQPVAPKPVPEDDFFKDRSWNAYEELQHMQDEMDQMFNQSMSRFHMKTPLGSLNKTPDVDLKEKPDQFIVTVNAPGADESSIDVKLDDRQLSISIKTEQAKEESDDQNGQYKYRERFVGEFHRVVTLPGPADASKMKTDYRNGVLTITIPKK